MQFKDGAGWLVVPRADPVRLAEAGRRICAFDSGKLGRRSKYHDMAWLQASAVAVALG